MRHLLNVAGLALDLVGAFVILLGPRVVLGRIDGRRYFNVTWRDVKHDSGMHNFLDDKRRTDRVVQVGSSIVFIGVGLQLTGFLF